MEPPRRVVLGEGEQVERHVLEVVGQPLGRALHLEDLDGLGRLGVGVRRVDLRLVDRLPQLAHGVLVQGCEGRLLGRVVEEEETPVLLVAARGGVHGRIEDAGLDVEGDRVLGDPSHGTRRVQGLVEFHMQRTLGPGASGGRSRLSRVPKGNMGASGVFVGARSSSGAPPRAAVRRRAACRSRRRGPGAAQAGIGWNKGLTPVRQVTECAAPRRPTRGRATTGDGCVVAAHPSG